MLLGINACRINTMCASLALLGYEVALSEIRSFACLLALLLGGELSRLNVIHTLGSDRVGPVASEPLAVLSLEAWGASEFERRACLVATAVEIGLALGLVLKGATHAPAALSILFAGSDTGVAIWISIAWIFILIKQGKEHRK